MLIAERLVRYEVLCLDMTDWREVSSMDLSMVRRALVLGTWFKASAGLSDVLMKCGRLVAFAAVGAIGGPFGSSIVLWSWRLESDFTSLGLRSLFMMADSRAFTRYSLLSITVLPSTLWLARETSGPISRGDMTTVALGYELRA